MAQGLSIPSLSPDVRGRIAPIFKELMGKGSSPDSSVASEPTSATAQSSPDSLLDLFERSEPDAESLPRQAANGLQLMPDGTYRYSRTSLSASMDFSMSQTSAQISQTDNQGSMLASVRDLQVSIRVSLEFEQALIETGAARGSNSLEAMNGSARSVVERFKAEQIQASFSLDIAFSQSSLSIGGDGSLGGDLSSMIGDGSMGGYVTLLESLFGDDENFKAFIQRLKDFLSGMGGWGAPSAPVDASSMPAPGASSYSAQSQSLSVSVEMSMQSTSIQVSSGGVLAPQDPIVIDMDGDGIELTSADEGVQFDLDADGLAEKMATVFGGDAFLALDRNQNGRIDDGAELFGDQNGAKNGFAELARYDSNKDGEIDARDVIFQHLKVFSGVNGGLFAATGGLTSLTDAGIKSINLASRDVAESTSGGNTLAQISSFTKRDGTQGMIADALLNRII